MTPAQLATLDAAAVALDLNAHHQLGGEVRAIARAHRCTCPSGDGSLRWPCPEHPPVAKEPLRVTHGYRIPEERPTVSGRNPGGEPTGDGSGRCWKCGSSNLWDDNFSYGCNDCGMLRIGA